MSSLVRALSMFAALAAGCAPARPAASLAATASLATPSPLVTLDAANFETVRASFNAALQHKRVVALLSPS